MAVALCALSGCSFIDDWGALSIEPSTPPDGGLPDGMLPDAGPPSGAEGDACGEGLPCQEGHTCLSRTCFRVCADPSDCADARLGPLCAVLDEATGEGFCAGAMCNFVEGGDCDVDGFCHPLGVAADGAMASVCHDRAEDAPVGVGESCDGALCDEGSLCLSIDDPRCYATCWPDEGDCADGRACFAVPASDDTILTLNGREIGVCYGGTGAQGDSCAVDEDCYAASLCWEATCRILCFNSEECPTGSDCQDIDGDGTTECL